MNKIHIHNKLLAKCKKGNTKAQFEIYKLYFKGMYNVSFRIVKSQEEAEDVMQEAFLAAFSKLNTWSQEVTFGAWLKKIVVNKSLDYLKKRKMQLVEIENKNIVEENYINNDESIKLKVELIKKTVSNLPETYRIVATLFLFEGYTHSEIANFLDIKPETARIRFMRAKKMIQQAPGLKSKIHKIILN